MKEPTMCYYLCENHLCPESKYIYADDCPNYDKGNGDCLDSRGVIAYFKDIEQSGINKV